MCDQRQAELRQAILSRLNEHGVTVERVAGAVRLRGRYGDVVMVHDLAALRQRVVTRLCG